MSSVLATRHRTSGPARAPGLALVPALVPALALALGLGTLLSACGTSDADAPAPGEAEREVAATWDGDPETIRALGLGALAQAALESTRVSAFGDVLLDEIGARISALPSGQAAQDQAEAWFREFGLENVRQESFDLLAWDRVEAELEILEAPSPLEGPFPILSLGHVGSHEVEAELLDAGFGTAEEIESLGEAVRGRIVVVDVSAPPGHGRGVHRTEKVTLATRAGAVGFLQVNNREGELVPIGVATMGDVATEIPAAATDLATGDRLRDALTEGPVRARLRVENWMERSTAANVLADLPGETDEVIVVGAHLDSWDLATGAVDNGSGSMAVLDLARALAQHVERTGERPRRTLRFALWMGEELGLYGSRAYVDARLADGRLERHVATLNLDVVGAPVGLGAMGRPEGHAFLDGVRGALVEAGFELEAEHATGGGIYSDHQPFLMEGIPVVSLRSRQRPEAAGVSHTTADVREVLDEEGIAASAAISAALLWALASVEPFPYARWDHARTGERLEALGVRDPLERAGEWRWGN
jgi:carboxypeptidase Q